ITGVYRRFYTGWDEAAYRRYLSLFQLDEEKTPGALSAGMKVKYSLALALSHHAQLLLLDEPTSGLDPVSRDELLDVFLRLVEEEGITILFSTHIISDLERCADHIIYIKNGEIIADRSIDAFVAGYKVVHMHSQPDARLVDQLIGVRKDRTGYAGLIETSRAPAADADVKDADLETIMLHLERSERI
ncbi:AAA family ATPase, partial [Cutibacterium acnes]